MRGRGSKRSASEWPPSPGRGWLKSAGTVPAPSPARRSSRRPRIHDTTVGSDPATVFGAPVRVRVLALDDGSLRVVTGLAHRREDRARHDLPDPARRPAAVVGAVERDHEAELRNAD